jgi:hypothetical protein
MKEKQRRKIQDLEWQRDPWREGCCRICAIPQEKYNPLRNAKKVVLRDNPKESRSMRIDFECKQCGRDFECEVGKIS